MVEPSGEVWVCGLESLESSNVGLSGRSTIATKTVMAWPEEEESLLVCVEKKNVNVQIFSRARDFFQKNFSVWKKTTGGLIDWVSQKRG